MAPPKTTLVVKEAPSDTKEAKTKEAPTKTEPLFTKADLDEAVKKAIAEQGYKEPVKNDMASLLKDVLPTIILAMEQAKNQTAHDITLKSLKAKLALEEKCHICKQSVGDGKGRGCGGPWARNDDGSFKTLEDGKTRIEDVAQFHTHMVVYPSDPIAEGQFDGVQINGAHYRSQGPNHKVWVPKQNNIASIILKFEEDQRVQQIGRKHMRQSGSIGKNGPQVNSPTFT